MLRPVLVFLSCIIFLPAVLFAQKVDVIQLIMEKEQEQAIELLKADPKLLETRNEDFNSTLLHIAAQAGSNKVMQYLFTTDIGIDTINWDWHTALHWAAYVENLEGINLLLEKGASLEAATYKGETPLRIAVQYGKADAARALIKAGADINTKSQNEVSLLHAVALGGDAQMAAILLENDLNIDSRNLYGKTPLHYGASVGNTPVVRFLLDRGADKNANDVTGRNALDMAQASGQDEVIKTLESSGIKSSGYEFPKLAGPYLGQTPPGVQPQLFAPGIVSSEGWEFAPTITVDGQEFLFTRRGGENNLPGNTIMTTNCFAGNWHKPEVADFSGDYFDYEPFVIDHGRRLIFGSRRPLPDGTDNGEVNQWVLDRKSEAWTNLQPFGPPLENRKVMFPTMADNGNLYFSGPGQDDQYDLFVCVATDNGYLDPVTLGASLGQLSPKMHPYIAPDESYVLFDAQPNAPQNYDNYIYVSFHNHDGSWTVPTMLDLQHPAIDNHGIASVSSDGQFMFFSSGGNIFWVDAVVIEGYRR